MKKIETKKAPAAIGPYSQAMIYQGVVYTSGQLAINPETGELADNDITVQADRVCRNLAALLESAGSSMDLVIKSTCFLADMNDFPAFNAVYEKYFPSKPARSCVAVKTLPKNALVEVEVIAELA